MKTIALVQLKGGTGRSTVATLIAAQLGSTAPVVLIDCDSPQLSSFSWAAVRAGNEKLKGKLSCEKATTAEELKEAIGRAAEAGASYCVLDCAPRLETLSRAALMYADLVLVPIGPSLSDVWATQDLAALLKQAEEIRSLKVRALWNKRGATRLSGALMDGLKEVFPYPALTASLSYRVCYAEAFGEGMTVLELPGAPAAARREASALIEEVKKLLRK